MFLVETGEIPMSRIDDAVERILRVKFISGVFEHPFLDPSLLDIVGCKVRCPTSIFLFLFIYSPYFSADLPHKLISPTIYNRLSS